MSSVVILSTIKMYKGNSAGSSRIMNIARALSEHQVSVYLYSSRLNKNIQRISEVERGIYVVGEEAEVSSSLSKITRRLFTITTNFVFVARVLKEVQCKHPTAVVLVYPSITTSMDLSVLLILKIFGRTKIYCDVNELRTAELMNRSFSDNFFLSGLQRILIRFDYLKFILQEHLTKHFDGLIAISTHIEAYFKKINLNVIRVPILTNVVDKPFTKAPAYKNGEKFLIGFTGSVYLKKEGIDTFYKALSALNVKCPYIEVHFYGPILKHERDLLLEILPKKYGLMDKVFYHGIVDQESLPNILSKHHLLILPRPLTAQTKYGFSTKLAEYMVSGVPVLVTDVSDNCLYIHDEVNGFVVPANDALKMSGKIEYIINNYNSFANAIAGRAFETAISCFHYSNYGKILSNFITNE